MKKFDLRTPIIYVLTFIILILLIVMKKMDDEKKEKMLEEKMVVVEKKRKEKEELDVTFPQKPEPGIKGIIGLVIDDFGYRNDEISDGFLELDARLTYAVIPGHRHSTSFGQKAVESGYEVIVHMPMENTGKTYGEEEFVLMTAMDSETIQRRINNAIKDIPNAIGMNNHQGSKATSDSKTMTVLASVLKDRGKYFIDSRTSPLTIGEKTMISFGVPTARRNIFLDNNNDLDKIEEQMNKLANSAKKNGVAVGLGHARKNTLSVIEKVVPNLLDKGFVFQFASQIVK